MECGCCCSVPTVHSAACYSHLMAKSGSCIVLYEKNLHKSNTVAFQVCPQCAEAGASLLPTVYYAGCSNCSFVPAILVSYMQPHGCVNASCETFVQGNTLAQVACLTLSMKGFLREQYAALAAVATHWQQYVSGVVHSLLVACRLAYKSRTPV